MMVWLMLPMTPSSLAARQHLHGGQVFRQAWSKRVIADLLDCMSEYRIVRYGLAASCLVEKPQSPHLAVIANLYG